VQSTNPDVSELPASTRPTEVPRNVDSSESFGSKGTSEGLQEGDKTESKTEEELKVFHTDENSVTNSDKAPLYETVEATVSSRSPFKRNRQPQDATQSDHPTASSDIATGVTNKAFETDEISRKEDVQVGLI